MIYQAVIDTNVIISALLSKNEDAATVQIMQKMFDGEIIPLYNDITFEEYRDVLCRKKFNFPLELIEHILEFIKTSGICINPSALEEELIDMDDLPFYEIVMEKQDEKTYLITGNLKHFPEQKFIITPKEMLDIIDG